MFAHEHEMFIYTHFACGLLSCLSSLFIIVYCIYQKALKVYSFKLIFYFSIAQFFSSLGFVIPGSVQGYNKYSCSFFGIFMNSCQMITILWITCIANCIRQAFIGCTVFFEQNEIYWKVVAIFIIPLLNLIPAFTGSYELVDNYCTYNENTDGNLERVFIFFIPVWGMLIYTLFCYGQVFVNFKRTQVSFVFKSIIKKLMFYQVLMVINVVFMTILRFPVDMNECQFEFYMFFSGIFMGLNGFFNLIIFVCTPGNMVARRKLPTTEPSDDFAELSSTLNIVYESGIK